MKKICNITIDVDTLRSNFKGAGNKNSVYSGIELPEGIERSIDFFKKRDIKAVYFCVAADFENGKYSYLLKKLIDNGHEIASHSYSHPQGFRLLSVTEKKKEILLSKKLLEDLSDSKIFGFRAPGWNIDDETMIILKECGYLYDSSIFPTFIMPALKMMHYMSMKRRTTEERTTMGLLKYMLYSIEPHITKDKLFEFPIQVSTFLRLPFFATFYLQYPKLSNYLFSQISHKTFINFQMHLSDFADYYKEPLRTEFSMTAGSYVSASVSKTLQYKEKCWDNIFDKISQSGYSFITLNSTINSIKA